MSTETKRFEEWEEIDCNTCQHYWDSSCDTVGAFRKPCHSYIATRRIDIPTRIEYLDKKVKNLTWSIVLLAISVLTHYIWG